MQALESISDAVELPYSAQNPPPSLADAEARRLLLADTVADIQTQLGNRNRTYDDGTPMESPDYWEWRHRASWAWKSKMAELRFVKAWITEQRGIAHAARERQRLTVPRSKWDGKADDCVSEDDPLSVLAALYDICAAFARDDQPLTKTERAAIGIAYHVLKAHGREPNPDQPTT